MGEVLRVPVVELGHRQFLAHGGEFFFEGLEVLVVDLFSIL